MKRLLIFSMFAITALSVACSSGAKSGGGEEEAAAAESTGLPTNSELRVGMSQEFENLNPIIMQMQATTYIYKMVNRNLATIDADNKWVPQLVTELPTFENGRAKITNVDGVEKMTVDWEIREGVVWGDGEPVTGHDVAFAHRVALSDNVSVGERDVYSQIERFEVDPQNPRKFRAIHEKIRWDFVNSKGTFYVLPKHLEEPIFEQYKDVNEGYAKNSLYTTEPTNPGLYNGPYRVAEIKLGSHVTVVPNEKFSGHKPSIQKIILRYIPETSALEASLRSGSIDMISVLGLKLDQAIKFEKTVLNDKLPYKVLFTPGTVYEHIDLQLEDNPMLQDVRVRKALVHAINRDELTKSLFEDRQKKAIHNIAPVDKQWYTDDPAKVVLYDYSRSTANKLLDESGWAMGDDGYRHKNGEKLSFQLMTTAGDKTRELVQVFLQNQWKKVGVEITIKNEPARVYFGETVRKGQYPAMAMFAWISSPENAPKSTLYSKNIPNENNGWSGQNSGGYVNADVDKLLDQVEGEMDAAKRAELIAQVLYHYTNDVPVIPLYYRANISVVPQNFSGYRMPGHQFSATNHVEYWNLDSQSITSTE